MKLLIKLPTRQRPEKALNLVGDYIAKVSGNHDIRFVISTHSNDQTMNTAWVNDKVESLRQEAIERRITLTHVKHDGTTKIHAYNSNPHCDDWDIQMATSDDMTPVVNGYDDIIIDTMRIYFPNTKGILHFDDGFTDLMTLPIVGREWYNQFNYIYNPIYTSLFCDNEMEQVAKRLRQYRYDNRVIIRHDHPVNVQQPMDQLMKYTESFYDADQVTYNRRKRQRFGLKLVSGRWTV